MESLDQNNMELGSAVANIHKELIDACRHNDSKAQLEIYKLYYKAMYNTSLRIVNDPMEAEDIMQESFLDAFRKIDSYRGESSFGSWLKRIVVNRSIDAVKRNKQVLSIDESNVDIPDTNEDEDSVEILTLRVEEIRKTIHLLPESYRVVLSLFLIEGYDHDEIAQILEISNNLSRIRYFRAKQKLLEYISRRDAGSSGLFKNN